MARYDAEFKTWLEGVKEDFTVVTYGCCTNKTGTVLVVRGDLNEECVVLTYLNNSLSGWKVVTYVVVNKEDEYGYSSLPTGGTFILGDRLSGNLPLGVITSLLPESEQGRLAAKNYLAKNPDMLIGKLSDVLQTQQGIINRQQSFINKVDWELHAVYESVNKSAKKMISMFTHYLVQKTPYLPTLKTSINKENNNE